MLVCGKRVKRRVLLDRPTRLRNPTVPHVTCKETTCGETRSRWVLASHPNLPVSFGVRRMGGKKTRRGRNGERDDHQRDQREPGATAGRLHQAQRRPLRALLLPAALPGRGRRAVHGAYHLEDLEELLP